MSAEYDRAQIMGIDLHRRRSVIVRMDEAGQRLDVVRIDNDPMALAAQIAQAGEHPLFASVRIPPSSRPPPNNSAPAACRSCVSMDDPLQQHGPCYAASPSAAVDYGSPLTADTAGRGFLTDMLVLPGATEWLPDADGRYEEARLEALIADLTPGCATT